VQGNLELLKPVVEFFETGLSYLYRVWGNNFRMSILKLPLGEEMCKKEQAVGENCLLPLGNYVFNLILQPLV
jgi:hypothetical protein